MINLARNRVAWLIGLLCALLITAALVFEVPALVKAATSFISVETSQTATTTVNYMVQGTTIATTTYQIDGLASNKVQEMGEVDTGQLFIQFAPSSTGSVLAWQFQSSNNNIDWYGESTNLITAGGAASTSANGVQEATSSVTHIWTPAATATSSKMVSVPIFPARHERVLFWIPAGADRGAIYFEVAPKRLPTTP